MLKQNMQRMQVRLQEDENKMVVEMKPHLTHYENSCQQVSSHFRKQEKLQNQMEKQDQSQSQNQSMSSDVSFEDEILQQHETALRLEIKQNERLFILQTSCKKQNQNLLKTSSFQHHLKQTLIILPKTFQLYLQNHKTFTQFLNHIHYSYQERISNKLLQLSFMVWNFYRPFLKMNLNERQISHIAKEMSTKLFIHDNIFEKNIFSSNLPQKGQKKLAFIRFFAHTLLFMIQGLFKNSYIQGILRQKSLTRSSSIQFNEQGSNEVNMTGRKIIKAQII